jgi:hypothetical protein
MKGLISFFLRDKHKIPPMSLAEIGFALVGVFVTALLVAVAILP